MKAYYENCFSLFLPQPKRQRVKTLLSDIQPLFSLLVDPTALATRFCEKGWNKPTLQGCNFTDAMLTEMLQNILKVMLNQLQFYSPFNLAVYGLGNSKASPTCLLSI